MQTKSLKDLVHFAPDDVRREALFETENLFSEVLCFDGKQHVGPLEDPVSDALFTVLAGEGRFNVGRRGKTMRQWGAVLVPAGSQVTIINLHDEPLVVMLVASPPPGDQDEWAEAGAGADAGSSPAELDPQGDGAAVADELGSN